jgi:Holliday junction DNA helicase RuvA
MPLARLRGTVDERGDDWVIVSVGGMGLLASVPASTADGLVPGAPAALYTHLHVREDALTLYGFATRDDLRLFEQLISVSGVGPRVALGLLSSLDNADLTTAIASGRADALRKVSGVGQKTAERIVLDLRDKVTPPEDARPAGPATAKEPAADAEFIAAMMALGYTQAEAAAAFAQLPQDADMPLEERIRVALSYFAG